MTSCHIFQAQALEAFTSAVCRAAGADEEVAAEVGRHLVRANLSGHDSHGVLRLPQYLVQVRSGDLVAAARPAILRASTVTALIDARRGFGHYSTAFALQWAMGQARRHGLAAAAVRHSTHIGRLGEYTERAGEQGLIAIVMVGAAGTGVGGVVPFHGRRRFLGTNPWSIGVPAHGRPPMVYDGATSITAEGKLRVARSKGLSAPAGCVVDREGRPSPDPAAFYDGGALVPLGGEVAGHKGYGLAMAAALIGGLAMIDDGEHTLSGSGVPREGRDRQSELAGVFVAAIDPAAFGDPVHYCQQVAEVLAAAQRVPPAPGPDRVLVPGEPEVNMRRAREREGIPLPEATWQELAQVGEALGVPLPEPVSSEGSPLHP